jgi:hypothetical protein
MEGMTKSNVQWSNRELGLINNYRSKLREI